MLARAGLTKEAGPTPSPCGAPECVWRLVRCPWTRATARGWRHPRHASRWLGRTSIDQRRVRGSHSGIRGEIEMTLVLLDLSRDESRTLGRQHGRHAWRSIPANRACARAQQSEGLESEQISEVVSRRTRSIGALSIRSVPGQPLRADFVAADQSDPALSTAGRRCR